MVCMMGWDFIPVFRLFNIAKIVTPCFVFLAGPWWDSEIEKRNYKKAMKQEFAKVFLCQTFTLYGSLPFVVYFYL